MHETNVVNSVSFAFHSKKRLSFYDKLEICHPLIDFDEIIIDRYMGK